MKTSNKILYPAVGICVGCTLYVGIREVCKRDRTLYYAVSRLLELLQTKPSLESRMVRKLFQSEAMPSANLVDGHSHAEAARDRNIGSMFCRKLAHKLHRPAYSYQMSKSDQDHKVAGYRDWRWSKDIPVSPRYQPEQGMAYMVDVDYYVEMGRVLAGKSDPVLIYTTQPSKVANSKGDTVHYFSKDNKLITHVSGGAKYEHPIWDYNRDSVMAVKRIFGIPICVTHCLVDQRHVNSEKKLVMFTPVGTWTGLSCWFALWWIRGEELTHLKPVENGWSTLYSQSSKGLVVSIGRAGTYGEATVPAETLEQMFAADRLSKQNANVGSVASWAESDRKVGVIIADFIRENKSIKAPYVANVSDGVIGYSADLTCDDNDKSTIAPFMPAVVAGGCFAPAQDTKTTSWGVESRVTNLKQIRSLTISRIQRRRALDFVKRVVNTGKLSPVDFEAVWENQTRTTQRAILEEASNTGEVTDDTISSFMKREAYAKVGTPRVISTLPGLTKLEYSRYTLAASKHIKEFSWYAFRKPMEIAERVAEIVNGAVLVAETDFSRMDGHVTQEVREMIEEPIMIGLFGEDPEMIRLMREQYNKDGQLGSRKYETGFARASGSPETSLFNTILTAFISFSAMCEMGMDYDEAWKSLGVYGGDDGLVTIPPRFTAEQADISYRNCAVAWGQVLKLDFKKTGEPVQFLARFYGNAWTGGLDSMSDVKRQLVKFHTTISLVNEMTPEQKAMDKACAILLTDKNTPILGDFARKVASLGVKRATIKDEQAFRYVSYWAKFDIEDQFPNEYGIWMEDVIYKQMPDFDHETFNNWVKTGNPMAPPQCLDLTPETYKPEVTCIINDDIHQGTGIKPSNAKQASPEGKQDGNQTDHKERSTHFKQSEKLVNNKPCGKVNNQSKKFSTKKTTKNDDNESRSSKSSSATQSRRKPASKESATRRKTERQYPKKQARSSAKEVRARQSDK